MTTKTVSTLLCLVLYRASIVHVRAGVVTSISMAPLVLNSYGAVMSKILEHHCSVFFFINQAEPYQSIVNLAPMDVSVYGVESQGRGANTTFNQLSNAIGQARRLRQETQCVTVVVVSDDPAFLTTFAEWSLKGRLLVWSTRLLVLTRLPVARLGGLQKVLSVSSSMLLIYRDDLPIPSDVISVYVQLPYPSPGQSPLKIATWTASYGLVFTSQLPLFPPKYTRFLSAPTLTVAFELFANHQLHQVKDPKAPGGYRYVLNGALDDTVRFIARGMNFTFYYARSQDHAFGSLKEDGSWTGMIGMLVNEEADFATGPFTLTTSRAKAVDYSSYLWIDNNRIVSGRGQLEEDPWGFLLPLTPLVWTSVLGSLLGVLLILVAFANLKLSNFKKGKWATDALNLIRIVLQQDVVVEEEWWWCQRVVVGVWMLTTLVLTKSYAGNLVSLLAVRHIPQPFQNLRDVLDHPSVAMIWEKYSAEEQYIRTVKAGIYREVAEKEADGRLMFHTLAQLLDSLNDLVRPGSHVLVNVNINVQNLIAELYTKQGTCNYFTSKSGFLPFTAALTAQKDSPLVHGLNYRVMSLLESGLYDYWMRSAIPNSTVCANQPRKILVQGPFSVKGLGGVFLILVGGIIIASIGFVMEIVVASVNKL